MLGGVFGSATWSKDIAAGATLSLPSFKALTIETIAPYTVYQYTPPYLIKMIESAAAARYSTPEETLIAFFSSMTKGDVVWNNEMWTIESLSLMKQRDKAEGKTDETWRKQWLDSFPYVNVRLLNRIEYASYVLIEYEVIKKADAKSKTDTLALIKRGDRWFVTQELASDPILLHWKFPGRVQAVPKTFFNK